MALEPNNHSQLRQGEIIPFRSTRFDRPKLITSRWATEQSTCKPFKRQYIQHSNSSTSQVFEVLQLGHCQALVVSRLCTTRPPASTASPHQSPRCSDACQQWRILCVSYVASDRHTTTPKLRTRMSLLTVSSAESPVLAALGELAKVLERVALQTPDRDVHPE